MNKLNFKMKSTKYYYSRPAFVKYLKTLVDGQGNVLYISDKDVVTPTKRIPRICVASVYDHDTNTMYFGASICSPKDQFKKSVGREIAYKRALKTPMKTTRLKAGAKIRNVSVRYANEIIDKLLKEYV